MTLKPTQLALGGQDDPPCSTLMPMVEDELSLRDDDALEGSDPLPSVDDGLDHIPQRRSPRAMPVVAHSARNSWAANGLWGRGSRRGPSIASHCRSRLGRQSPPTIGHDTWAGSRVAISKAPGQSRDPALLHLGSSEHLFYYPLVAEDRLEQAGLNKAWIAASAALPLEWHLDGLTCASTGLAPEQRSDRWRAWAVGSKGERIAGEGEGPVAALNALARELEPLRGSRSG